MRRRTQTADDLELLVGRRLPPSHLGVFRTTSTPRRQHHQASEAPGFPRGPLRLAARFEAARQEPSPYQMFGLRVSSRPSRPSRVNLFPASAPAEPSVYRSASLNEPKLRRSDPVRPLLRSLGINSSTHSINRTALRARGATSRTGAFAYGMAPAGRWAESQRDSAASRSAAGPTPTVLRPKLHPGGPAVLPSIRFIRVICGPNLGATSRSSRMDLLAGRGRPGYGARRFMGVGKSFCRRPATDVSGACKKNVWLRSPGVLARPGGPSAKNAK